MFAQDGGKIRKPIPRGDNEHEDQYHQDVYKAVTQILDGLNKNISYGNGTNTDENQNIDGYHTGLTIAPGVANTTFTITHNLGRVPIGFQTINRDNAGQCYAFNIAGWTTTQAFFRDSNAFTHVYLFIF